MKTKHTVIWSKYSLVLVILSIAPCQERALGRCRAAGLSQAHTEVLCALPHFVHCKHAGVWDRELPLAVLSQVVVGGRVTVRGAESPRKQSSLLSWNREIGPSFQHNHSSKSHRVTEQSFKDSQISRPSSDLRRKWTLNSPALFPTQMGWSVPGGTPSSHGVGRGCPSVGKRKLRCSVSLCFSSECSYYLSVSFLVCCCFFFSFLVSIWYHVVFSPRKRVCI